jgi:alpha-glucuronidase
VWEGLVDHYTRGAVAARGFVCRWQALTGRVDEERYAAVLAKLERQAADAAAWRDTCLTYFAQFSKGAVPPLSQ